MSDIGAPGAVGVPAEGGSPITPNNAQAMSMLAQSQQWMPTQTMVALANSGMSPQTASTVAENMKGVYAQAGGGVSNVFTDDVLQKQPTTLTAIKDFLVSTKGVPPIEAKDIQTVQTGLQAKGFGTDLQAGTPWNQGWMGAYRNYMQAYNNEVLAGAHQPLSKPAGGAFHWLTDILPKEAGDALIGYMKSLPGDAKHVMSSVVGFGAGAETMAANLPGQIVEHGISGIGKAEGIGNTAAIQAGARFEGKSTSDYVKQYNLMEQVNTVLTVASLVKMAAGTSLRVAEGIGDAGAMTPEEAEIKAAMNIPGRQAFASGIRFATGDMGVADAGAGLKGGAAMDAVSQAARMQAQDLGFEDALRTPGVIAKSMGRSADLMGAGIGKLGALTNFPALERSGMWVGKLNDADGLYYRARSIAAMPYSFKAIGAAGSAIQNVGLYGAAARLDAQAVQTLGGSNQFSSDVQNTHTLNAVDAVLAQDAKIKAFGITIKPSLDDLAYLLHAPGGIEGASSKVVSAKLGHVVDSFDHSLGATGVIQAYEKAWGMSVKQMETLAGVFKGDPEQQAIREVTFKKLLLVKVHQFAMEQESQPDMSAYADQLGAEGKPVPSRGTPQWITDVQHPVEEKVLNDPERMDRARQSLTSQPDRLEMMLKREIEMSAQKGQPEMTPGLDKYLTAQEHMPVIKQYERLLTSTLHDDSDDARLAHAQAQASQFVGPDEPFNDPMDSAGVSVARMDTLTKQGAERAANQFQELQDHINTEIPPSKQYEATNKLYQAIHDYITKKSMVDARKMPHDVPGLIQFIRDMKPALPSDVFEPTDAPAELTLTRQKINALGYKLVAGKNIDWMQRDLKPLDAQELGAPLAFRRKLLASVGANPTRLSPFPIAVNRTTNAMTEVRKAEQSGKLVLPPGYTAATAVAEISDKDNFIRTPGVGLRLGSALTRPSKRMLTSAKTILEAKNVPTTRKALDTMARQLVMEEAQGQLGLGATKRSDIINHFTRNLDDGVPDSVRAYRQAEGEDPGGQLMTHENARALADAFLRGYGSGADKYQMGISHLEDMMRAGFGFAGQKLPGEAGSRIANLPNQYIRLRNEFRFGLNPELSLRKIAKINVMMAANDVTPTVRPWTKMAQMGTLEHDKAVLTRIDPHNMSGATADLEKELEANDIFHLYNHEDYKAYAAGSWARQGLSDEQIASRLVRVFDYGSYNGGKIGRSAAERSMNFMFFPFSFDKKLYRNLGYYFLDRPGQTLLLNNALAAYNQFNHDHPANPMSTPWITSHLPVAQELERVNAFAHGVSLGQFGGVNAPVLNLFLPQVLKMNSDDLGEKVNAIQQFIPAIKMAQNIMSEGHSQAQIAAVAFGNKWDDQFGSKPIASESTGLQFKNIQQANETKWTQFEDGYSMYSKLETSFADILKFNTGKTKANQFKIPMKAQFGKFAGEPFTATTLREIIHTRYPAFTVEGGEEAAAINTAKVDQYLLNIKGTPDEAEVRWILTTSQALARNIAGTGSITWDGHSIKPTPEARLAIQNAVRSVAVQVAEHDPHFKIIWDKYFTASMGPLEKVS